MIIKHAQLRDREGLWDIVIDKENIVDITKDYPLKDQDKVIDARENLVTSPFIEPHTHLDYALTAGNPSWNMTGTLSEGLNIQRKRGDLSKQEIKTRARKAIKWYIANGVQIIRTHTNISDSQLIGLHAMLELQEEFAHMLELQIVAFPQQGIYTDSKMVAQLEAALKEGADVVGGAPHFEFTREDSVQSVKKIFELSQKYNCMIDIHCDETDDDHSRALEVVIAEAYHMGIGHLVSASHTTAFGSYNNAYAYKILENAVKSNINFIANPLVNINLQGRYDSYPVRRGLTRVKELLETGINVCFGHDDLLDSIYPLGTANMLQVLLMGIHVCHLTGYDQMNKSLDLITTNSAKTVQVEQEYGIEVGKPANFIILQAKNDYDALRRQSPILYSIRQGNIIAENNPLQAKLWLGNEEDEVEFLY